MSAPLANFVSGVNNCTGVYSLALVLDF